MSTKAHAVCMHTQRRVEQQLVFVSHLSKQWHHPHLGGGGFLLWGAACAPKGGMCSEHLSDSWPSRLVPTLVVVPTWVFISTFSDTAGCLQPTTIVAIW